MFLPQRVLDVLISTKEQAFDVSVKSLRDAYELALGAKESEVAALKRQVEDLEQRLKYERSRADALVDRLLVRDAKVLAVAPAAVEAARQKDEVAVKRLTEAFEQLNGVGEIPPAVMGAEPRKVEFAGKGAAVAAGV